jgi:GNAT superfamily N-acetyltransferase
MRSSLSDVLPLMPSLGTLNTRVGDQKLIVHEMRVKGLEMHDKIWQAFGTAAVTAKNEDAMHVRGLRPSDVEIATELLCQLGYHMSASELAARIAQVSTTDGHYAAVVDDGQKICGLMHVYERPALEKPCEAVVQSLVVEERARKTGAGRLLMGAAEAWARERGLNRVVLHTRIDRDDARAFYERIGYARAATAHLMSKQLRAT